MLNRLASSPLFLSAVLGGAIAIVGDRGTDVRILLPRTVGAHWPAQELTAGASR